MIDPGQELVTKREQELESLLKQCLEAGIDRCPDQGDGAIQAPWLRKKICDALEVTDPWDADKRVWVGDAE